MLKPARYWLVVLVLSLVWRLLARPAQRDIHSLLKSESDGPSNVLLLTAHPDDECMFFAPTILALQEAPLRHRPSCTRSVCRDLQDNFTAEWEPEIIADTLRPFVFEHHIDTILTFDHHGISSHPNHISLPKGAAHLLHTLSTPAQARPRLFALVTVPLREKYLGVLSPLLARASLGLLRQGGDGGDGRVAAVAVAGVEGYARAHRAMRQHWSQLVWFRWLYVSFSRYMWVNEWVEVGLPDDA
uniref:N-acetylglucosaminylphosphatidylinositol deacetylase n=1 Tax=Ganoderma boninense TaxID=34458 RepID=A0A5K1JSA5_9APHY|nr:GlcNAc-PI de-N-acetylase [Ganoderma boninense]